MTKPLTSEQIDELFDAGEDISEHLDQSQAHVVRVDKSSKKAVSLTPSDWVIATADREAQRLSISRSAVLNVWLANAAEAVIDKERRAALA